MKQKVPPRLPDEAINTLRQLLDMAEGYQFITGDYLVELVDEYSHIIKRADMIKQLAYECRCDASTLRDRESVCRFVSPDMRKDYEVFNWSQWRALKTAGQNWEEYAKQAAADMWSCERIRAEIKGNGHEQPRWVYWWDRWLEIGDKLNSCPDTPPEILRLTADLLEAAHKIEKPGS